MEHRSRRSGCEGRAVVFAEGRGWRNADANSSARRHERQSWNFEYIVDKADQVTHQRFIAGGVITGLPNQKPPGIDEMKFEVSSTFMLPRSHLTWREVEFGLQNGWLTDEAAIDLAIERVTAGEDSPDVVELASVLPHDKYKVPEIVRRLAGRDPECSQGRWLFLLLAWLYEQRDTVEEPLAVVEGLYADFDYPEEIANFVRYMPAQDPSRVGELYLLEAWRCYLETAGRHYASNAVNAENQRDR